MCFQTLRCSPPTPNARLTFRRKPILRVRLRLPSRHLSPPPSFFGEPLSGRQPDVYSVCPWLYKQGCLFLSLFSLFICVSISPSLGLSRSLTVSLSLFFSLFSLPLFSLSFSLTRSLAVSLSASQSISLSLSLSLCLSLHLSLNLLPSTPTL